MMQKIMIIKWVFKYSYHKKRKPTENYLQALFVSNRKQKDKGRGETRVRLMGKYKCTLFESTELPFS